MRTNPASLRMRTLFAFLLMLVTLVVVLQILAESIIGHGYRVVEEQTVRDRVEQAANALTNSLDNLRRVNRDYATWDNAYAFVSSPDPAFVATNLDDATLIRLGLSYVAFVNSDGESIYTRGFDLITEQTVPPPPELLRFDGLGARLLQHTNSENTLVGLVLLADQPMLLSAQPILPSQGEEPPAGTLLMGRYLDAHELAHLAAVTRLPVAVSRLDGPALAPELRQAVEALAGGQSVVAMPLDDQRIVGATRIDDLFGGPGLLLYLELPREVYQLGQQARSQYTLVLLGASLLFGMLVFWMLERTVLTRTITLNTQVAAADISRPEAQITVSGRDEIGLLGDAINQMLSRLRQAQEHIVASELRYRRLIEHTPDAIIIHDGRHIRYTNPAGARLFGDEAPATYIGHPVDPMIGAITPHPDGTPVRVDQLLCRPDGSVIEAELVVLPFPDRELPVTQVIVRNITERKQAEYALRAAKEAADAANRAKSQFLSTMSHELRTPLTAIIGYAELLDQELAASAKTSVLRDLGHIRSAGAHLLTIINDVLDLSKIEAGRMQVQYAPVKLEALLQTVVNTIQPLAEQNGNDLDVRCATARETVVTDETRLRQILINLLGNGCKFTQHGRVTLTVTSRLNDREPGSEQMEFAVQDTGIGIRPEEIKLLFRTFVQVDASATRRYGGTGLGLALSQHLARLMGGEITVVSEPGKGSTFTLTLPCRPPETTRPEPGGATTTPVKELADPPVAVATDHALETRIVLVIDDDPAVCDLLPRALAHQGLHFETATNDAEGLELAAALRPDLIVLTVLPEPAGWALLHQLKTIPATQAIPVLLLSTQDEVKQGARDVVDLLRMLGRTTYTHVAIGS